MFKGNGKERGNKITLFDLTPLSLLSFPAPSSLFQKLKTQNNTGSGWNLVYYAGVLESLQQAGALDPLTSRMAGVSGGSVAAATSGAGLSGKQMYDVLMQTLNSCEPVTCQIALAAVFRALLPPDVAAVYGSRVTIFMTRLNALGAVARAVAGATSRKTALIRTSSPAKNSSFAAASPAHAELAAKGRNWPSAADVADDALGAAQPWAVSTFAAPADVVGAVSSSSFLPCWSAPIPFYLYQNKPVIDGGFSTDFGRMCSAALNGTASGTECVRVAGSSFLGPYVKQGNADKSGKSCELPKKRKSYSLRKVLQMGVLPRAALAAEDAWLSEIDRSMAAEYPSASAAVAAAPAQQQQEASAESSSSDGDDAPSASASSASSSAAQAAAAAAAAAEASAAAQQSDPSAPPPLPPQPQQQGSQQQQQGGSPARLNPLTESLTALSFAVASAVSNATAGASLPTPSLPETTPLCPKKEAATFSWPRLVDQTEAGGPEPIIYPGKFAASPLPFTPCEWQKLVLNLTPAALPKVYAAGVADGAEWAAANGFCG